MLFGILSAAVFGIKAFPISVAVELTAARELPIRASHITALAASPMPHKDPFDRILIAQAVAEGLAIVRSDESIREYPVQSLW